MSDVTRVVGASSGGMDHRRRLGLEERRLLFERADGRCQKCGADLAVDWHGAHLLAWTHGGATELENMEAWCPSCNLKLGAQDAPVPLVSLREWQLSALPQVLKRLWQAGRATLYAAPGAGKTIFTGAVFHHLSEVGLVDRMLVVVPNRVLVGQWKRELSTNLQIHLDDDPRDGFLEHPSTVGAVVTYNNLVGAARNHRQLIDRQPTLVVFDEVHHLAEQRAWGRAARTMTVGEDGELVAAILNTTGTLFRSTRRERIPTVEYRPVTSDEGDEVLEAVPDFSVPAILLIGKELRPVDLHACGSSIELVDLREEEVISGEVADLANQRLMRAAHVRMIRREEWIEGFAGHMLNMLARQASAIEHAEPLKALWVASNQNTARMAAKIINRVAGSNFARLVISDDPAALRTLRRAVTEPRSCCIVAVQMVTEGFDCPQISTIAYAHNITADLYLTQMVARAMRLTSTERRLGRVLPAQVLIPDVPDLRRAFADVLVSKLHTLTIDDESEPEVSGQTGNTERLPRFDLTAVTLPRLEDVVVVGEEDGVVARPEHDQMAEILDRVGVPVVYAARAVVASREFSSERVLRDRVPREVTLIPAHPRDINRVWRDRVAMRARWWAKNGDVPIAQFQAEANDAAGIGKGERDQAAPEQLARVVEFMNAAIRQRCAALGTELPMWLQERE